MTLSQHAEHYAWKQHDSSPEVCRRLTLSSESLWVSRPRVVREIFVSGEVTVESVLKVEARHIKTAVRRVWRRLRFEVPELGVKGAREDGETWMHYVNPRVEDVELWVERTLFFSPATRSLDFADLRRKILVRKRGSEDPVVLLLHFHPAQDEHIEKLSIMMNTDHLATDGIGARILFGKFLASLTIYLSTWHERKGQKDVLQAEKEFEWGESWRNLSPPWISILKTELGISGKGFEDTVAYHRDIFMNKMSSNPGLPLTTPSTKLSISSPTSSSPSSSLTSTQPPSHKSYFNTFTTRETTSLLQSTKSQISPQATITHLTHAAMALALISHNRPDTSPLIPSQEDKFYSSCWLSGRRYLSDAGGKYRGGSRYIPVCMGFHPIIVPALQRLRERVEDCGGDREKKRGVLMEVCGISMREYGKLESRGNVLGEFLALSEALSTSMPDQEDGNDTNAKRISGRRAAPLLLSDGITESYISRSYPSPSSSPVITVNDIHFAANADAEVVLRLSTFRDRLRLSAEWRSEMFEEEMVREYVGGVKGWMMEVVE